MWVKEYIIKNFATGESFCNLQKLYTAFKKQHPNVKHSKFCDLRPKWCALAGWRMIISVLVDDLTRHSYIAKLKITSPWCRRKSKAPAGVTNISSYIPWLYNTWDQMVVSIMIHCVLLLMTTTITQAFLYQVQTVLVYYLKVNHPYIIKH